MKHIPIVAVSILLAAGLPAQDPDPRPQPAPATVGSSDALAELAAAVAAEQQEHDLEKAERLYRAARTDPQRSEAARALATLRLAALLQRLGRTDEARALSAGVPGAVVSLEDVTEQDAARTRELRAEARQLLEKLMTSGEIATHHGSELSNMTASTARQLLWLGEAAVPEVIAVLQERAARPYGANDPRCIGLAEFLWIVGGPKASAFLQQAAAEPGLRDALATGARRLQQIDLDEPALRAYLDHPDWRIAERVLGPGGRGLGFGILQRLTVDQVLEVAARGDTQRRRMALDELAMRALDEVASQNALPFVREALAGADPEYGNAADRFLTGSSAQKTPEGLRLLLERLPDLCRRNATMSPLTVGNDGALDERRFGPRAAELLVPAVDRAVAAIGPVEPDLSPAGAAARQWLLGLMSALVRHGGRQASAAAVGWWDAGYPIGSDLRSPAQIDAATAVAVLERFDRLPAQARMGVLYGADLSRALAPLTELLERHRDAVRVRGWLTALVAGTGDPAAAAVLLAEWRGGRLDGGSVVEHLIELLQHSDAAPVRAAALAVLRGDGGPRPADAANSARLLTLLLSLGDEAALEHAVVSPELEPVRFPLREHAPKLAPHEYLALREPAPPHPYSAERVVAALSRLASGLSGQRRLAPRPDVAAEMTDAALVAFAEHDRSGYAPGWNDLALLRLADQLAAGEPSDVLERWFRGALGRPGGSPNLLLTADEAVYRRYRDSVLALVDGDDEDWAYRALQCVERHEPARADVGASLRNRHAKIRGWAAVAVRDGDAAVDAARIVPLLADDADFVRRLAAQHLGNVLAIDAVPGLIALLRDPSEEVRKEAADALSKIRFYQEQKAHWDRVLQGLDASASSAAEKLLLQAKPDADKQQRLLAIRSLGVLGVPEALPFLIDWSQEADADVAEAARAAITKIHLEPRK